MVLALATVTAGLSIFCNRPKQIPSSHPTVYKNWSDSAHYVGMQTCRLCHESIYETFIQTGMGMSFDHATLKKTSAKFGAHDVIYDRYKNFYYHPCWKND